MKQHYSRALLVAAGLTALSSLSMAAARERVPFNGRPFPIAGEQTQLPGVYSKEDTFAKLSTKPDNLLDPERGPMRLTPAGGSLIGYNAYSPKKDWRGFYEMGTPSPKMLVRDWYSYQGMTGNAKTVGGWQVGDVLYGYATLDSFLGYRVFLETNNLSTGTQDGYRQLSVKEGFFLEFAYNPNTREIYGQGAYDGYYAWVKASVDNPEDVEFVADLYSDQYCVGMTYNPANDKYYGVTFEGALVEITRDGELVTIVEELDIPNFYQAYQGLAYSPLDDLLFFNSFTIEDEGYASYLYSIDLASGDVKKIFRYDSNNQYSVLFCNDELPSTAAPAKPVINDIDFEGPSRNGTITFTLPDTYYGGKELDGELDWELLLDNVKMRKGKGEAGETLSINVVNVEEGYHDFIIRASRSNETGPGATKAKYIGYGIPMSPSNVVLTETSISWDAVESGMYDSYVNPSEVTYTVTLNGVELGTVDTNSIKVNIPANSKLERYEAKVVAYFRGKQSEVSMSNSLLIGAPLKIGTNLTPSPIQADLFDVCGNGERQWSYNETSYGRPCFAIGYDFYNQLDSWLILPPYQIPDADDVYEIAFDLGMIEIANDLLEVCMGKSRDVKDMNIIGSEIIPMTSYTSPARKKVYFTVKEAGVYNFALHAISPLNQGGMTVSNLEVKKSAVRKSSPGAVTAISATPGAEGALKAKVSFRLPVKSVDGNDLPKDKEIQAEIRCVTNAMVSGLPGELVSATVVTEQSSYDKTYNRYNENRIEIVTYSGNIPGLPAEVYVYTGIGVPDVVEELRIASTEDNLGVVLSWEPPLGGEYGTWVDPENLTYVVYRAMTDYAGNRVWEAVGETTELTYTYRVEPGSPLDFAMMTVVGKTIAGEGNGFAVSESIGTPYELPMNCNFATNSAEDPFNGLQPFVNMGGGTWSIMDFSEVASDKEENKEGLVLYCTGNSDGDIAMLAMPRFSTLGCKDASYEMTVYVGEAQPAIYLMGYTYGTEPGIIGEFIGTEGLNTVRYVLPESLQNRPWVELIWGVSFTNVRSQAFMLRDFRILPKEDLSSVSLIGSDSSISGGKGEIRFHGLDGIRAEISRIDGAKVANVLINGSDAKVDVAKGIYVVKAGERHSKVIVR